MITHRAVHIGGLMRCCIQSIHQIDRDTTPGDTLACTYCGTISIVGADGCWRWASEFPKKLPMTEDA